MGNDHGKFTRNGESFVEGEDVLTFFFLVPQALV